MRPLTFISRCVSVISVPHFSFGPFWIMSLSSQTKQMSGLNVCDREQGPSTKSICWSATKLTRLKHANKAYVTTVMPPIHTKIEDQRPRCFRNTECATSTSAQYESVVCSRWHMCSRCSRCHCVLDVSKVPWVLKKNHEQDVFETMYVFDELPTQYKVDTYTSNRYWHAYVE